MGAGRQPDRMALRARDCDRNGAARSADQQCLTAVAGVSGAVAVADAAAAAELGAGRDGPRCILLASVDGPVFGDLRFDGSRRAFEHGFLAIASSLRG